MANHDLSFSVASFLSMALLMVPIPFNHFNLVALGSGLFFRALLLPAWPKGLRKNLRIRIALG
jgi:hypothetical protein